MGQGIPPSLSHGTCTGIFIDACPRSSVPCMILQYIPGMRLTCHHTAGKCNRQSSQDPSIRVRSELRECLSSLDPTRECWSVAGEAAVVPLHISTWSFRTTQPASSYPHSRGWSTPADRASSTTATRRDRAGSRSRVLSAFSTSYLLPRASLPPHATSSPPRTKQFSEDAHLGRHGDGARGPSV